MNQFKRIINNTNMLVAVIAVLALLLVAISLFPKSLASLGSKQKVYSVQVIKIVDGNDYFDLSLISGIVGETGNIKIRETKEISYGSDEAKALMEEYQISRVPSLIVVSRNIGKISLNEDVFRKTKDAAIFDMPVPYLDVESGSIKGLVSLKEVYDRGCKDCANLSFIPVELEKIGVKVKSYELVEASSDAGKRIINENNLSYLPSLLASKEINEYPFFSQIRGSFVENKEYYKFADRTFPSEDILTKSVKGKVKMTYLEDKSCADCFNITQLKPSFQRIGIYISNEAHIDVSSDEGKGLLRLYNITAVPTVILSKEIFDYPNIEKVLGNFGSFDKENVFVFRNLGALKVKYKEINQTVE